MILITKTTFFAEYHSYIAFFSLVDLFTFVLNLDLKIIMSFFDVHDLENISKNPFCVHGPTALFENRNQETKFYSCSAVRNHKKCNFYENQREFTESEMEKWRSLYKKCQMKFKRAKKMRLKLKSMSYKERCYCKTCDKFLFNEKQKEACSKHNILRNIKKSFMKEPTKLIINPLIDDDSNAVRCLFFVENFHNPFLNK